MMKILYWKSISLFFVCFNQSRIYDAEELSCPLDIGCRAVRIHAGSAGQDEVTAQGLKFVTIQAGIHFSDQFE
jgi:hypothetical protein